MKIYLIRHGKTKGNLEERYIGRTDEPLCEAGRENLKKYQYPQVEMVFTSPMKSLYADRRNDLSGAAVSMHRRIKREQISVHLKATHIKNCPVMSDIRPGLTAAVHCHFRAERAGKNVRDRCIRGIATALKIAEKEHASQNCICRTWWNDHERDGEICKTAGAVL